MTGFARADGRSDEAAWAWEARSVNGRGLDIRLRMPPGFESLEVQVRTAVSERFSRGNISLNLSVQREPLPRRLNVDQEALDQLVELTGRLERELAIEVAPPRLDGLLAIRGLVELVDEDSEARREAMRNAVLVSLPEVLDRLEVARRDEGRRLAGAIGTILAQLRDLVEAARSTASVQPDAGRTRLEAQLRELLAAAPPVSEERLAQELALIAAKADVREELDRLSAHLESAGEMLAYGGVIGRRLDFLCQELNREANTLCSKSGDLDLTRIGMDMKVAIDQLREQIQNLE